MLLDEQVYQRRSQVWQFNLGHHQGGLCFEASDRRPPLPTRSSPQPFRVNAVEAGALNMKIQCWLRDDLTNSSKPHH